MDNEFIFESLNECARCLNTDSGAVHRAINKGYKCKGHLLNYLEENK